MTVCWAPTPFLTQTEHCKVQLTVNSCPLEAHTCPGSWMVLVNRDGDLGKERTETRRTNGFLPRCHDEMQVKVLMSQSQPAWTSNLSRREFSNLVLLLLLLLSFVSFGYFTTAIENWLRYPTMISLRTELNLSFFLNN